MWVTSVIPGRSKFQKTRNLKRNDYDHHQKSGWVYSSHDQDAKFKFDRGWTTTITKIWTGHLEGQIKFQKTGFSKLLWLHSPSKNERECKKKNGLLKKAGSRVVKNAVGCFLKRRVTTETVIPFFWSGRNLREIPSYLWRLTTTDIIFLLEKANSKNHHIHSKTIMMKMWALL